MKRGLVERNGKTLGAWRRIPQVRRTQTEEGQPPEAYCKASPRSPQREPTANKLEKTASQTHTEQRSRQDDGQGVRKMETARSPGSRRPPLGIPRAAGCAAGPLPAAGGGAPRAAPPRTCAGPAGPPRLAGAPGSQALWVSRSCPLHVLGGTGSVGFVGHVRSQWLHCGAELS